MYVFSRRLIVQGDLRTTGSWAGEMAALVSRKTDLAFSLWLATGGVPVGTYVFSTRVESQVTLDAATSRLRADDEYLDLVAAGYEHFAAPPEDSLVEIVHASGVNHRRAEVGAIISVTSADLLPGQLDAAFRWGVEATDLVTEITGVPLLFARNVFGSFGGVEWIQTVADLPTFEGVEEQLNKDGRYRAKLQEIGGLFLEGSGHRTLGRRVA